MRNYRAVDIGGHFMQKQFTWFDSQCHLADCRRYSEAEKREFCAHYATEWNRVTGDTDTDVQVLREAECRFLLAITFDLHNMLWFMKEHEHNDPLDAQALNVLFDEFVRQYQELGMREP